MLDAITFELGSDTFELRPLFPALRKISQRYGGLVAAGARAEALDVDAMATIISDLLAANGHTMRIEVIGERMMEKPLMEWATKIMEVIAAAVTPGPEAPAISGDTKSIGGG